jgi:two-component system cell cycle sensor histidine kinase/response regulator CckA
MGPQVLIAEDETQLRELLAQALEDRNLRVAQAADGVEALNLLENRSSIQLLLSDIRMPRMDGYDLVEKALEVSPELKVLMMTAYAEDHLPTSALKAREIRTLQKPFDPDRLCDLVHEMLARP